MKVRYLVIFIILSMTVSAVSAAPTVSVEPSSMSINVGDTFTVNILVDPQGNEIRGAEFDLKYNSLILNATKIEKGPFLGDNTFSAVLPNCDNNANLCRYNEAILGAQNGTTTSGILATITFRADSAGTLNLVFSDVILVDPNANPILDLSTYNGKVIVYTIPAAPIPASQPATAGNGYVNLKWNAPSNNGGSAITNYKIYRGTTSGAETLLTTIGNMLTYNDTNVNNGQTYYYKISAVNSAGESANSSVISATPSAATSTPTPTQTSSGGGGGGGGGASSEDYNNIEKQDRKDAFVYAGKLASYDFANAGPITSVVFTGKKNFGEITVKIELLKSTSTLVNVTPPGTVYSNFNVWAGTSGFSSPENIENPVIKFRIEKDWLSSNKFVPRDIVTYRWDSNIWNKLETINTGDDDTYINFEAKTDHFSSFAISAEKTLPGVTETSTRIQIKVPDNGTELTPEGSPAAKSGGIEIILVIAMLLVSYIFSKKK